MLAVSVKSMIMRFGQRHASAIAFVVLVASVAGTGVALAAASELGNPTGSGSGDWVYVACTMLPYGVVGAILIARRPELAFGWLLSVGAMSLFAITVIGGASLAAIDKGYGGELAVWGLTTWSMIFVPVALQGMINTRFPSGAPTSRFGRFADRAIGIGIATAVLAGVLSDLTVRAFARDGTVAVGRRFIDGTPIAAAASVGSAAVPLVILLGLLAGVGVVVRFFNSNGVERQQLKWRAVGVVGALALFPFAVTESLPDTVDNLDGVLFTATLVVPIFRYDLWAIDSIIRRSAVTTFASPSTVVDNMVRAVAEMLRLPYVAVRAGERELARHGEPVLAIERWTLDEGGDVVGELVAAPRPGRDALSDQDRRILATVARLVGGSVRAEALTADLLDARQSLVAAREEERRRLRRELHDGLGPLLTGLGLNLDAAAAQLGRSEERTATYLGHAKAASSEVITSLREVVEGLRPPALDELGLAGALRLRLGRLAADAGLVLDIHLPSDLVLPAAVEVAAYRTAVEAVTNAARHSRARRVSVALAADADALTLTVIDDGPARTPWKPGTGCVAMRERAEELGGTFTAGPTSTGGLVHARYPLGAGR